MRLSASFLTSFVCMLILLTGCLKTRADLREDAEDQTPQRQTVAQQRAEQHSPSVSQPRAAPPANAASRFEEYDEQMRQLNGRLDVIDNAITQAGNAHQAQLLQQKNDRAAIDQKFVAYEEALKKLEAQVNALNDEVARLKLPPPPPPKEAAPTKGRSAYDEGEELFNAKKYKESIVAYQKYRDGNPKGKVYGDATYKIGVSFQELGLKDEARSFFEEVVAKFPGSKEAKKAAVRMKTLK